MELTNEFVIDQPVAETWRILNDLEFIAPCMPGAQLQEIEGDEYRGIVKVKVGPITGQYKGKASFISQDEAAGVAKLKAEGRDPRQGNANANVTATLKPSGDNATSVEIHTELSLSGKIASFGRSAIEDVSKKILGEFTDNLRAKLEAGETPAGSESASDTASTSGTASTTGGAGATAPKTDSPQTASSASATTAAASTGANANGATKPTVRKIDSPEPKPVDLIAVGGDSVVKKAAPVLGGVLLLFILRWVLGGRGSD